jgi:hypothetical protein
MDETHPLYDATLKISRARELAKRLVDFSATTPDGKPFTQKARKDPDGTLFIVLDKFPDWPHEWSMIASECVGHLRSALDYVVKQLVIENGGDMETRGNGWPISDDPVGYTKKRGRRKSYRDESLKGVAEKWKQVIDGLQPFPGATQAVLNLKILGDLTNRDKHQERLWSRTWALTPVGRYLIDRPERMEIIRSPDGLVRARATVKDGRKGVPQKLAYWPRDPELAEWGFAVGFGPEGVSTWHIAELVENVAEIIPKFEDAFGADS